jgi:hypothetical protein
MLFFGIFIRPGIMAVKKGLEKISSAVGELGHF